MNMQKRVITRTIVKLRQYKVFLISNVLRVLNVVFFLLGDTPAMNFTCWRFGTLFHLHRRYKLTPLMNMEQIVFRKAGTYNSDVRESPKRKNTEKALFDSSPQMAEAFTRAVRKVSSHFEYLENRSRGLDVTWQPIRGDLTVHSWSHSPVGLVSRQWDAVDWAKLGCRRGGGGWQAWVIWCFAKKNPAWGL